jgi:Helix-turn-helix of DDE superfamily endonuclease
MLFYRAAVALSRSTLNYVAGVIRWHRKSIGSTWRLLNPGQQALLVLVYLRKGDAFAEVAAGFEVSTTTAWRYIQETVKLLSARSPKLGQTLNKAKDTAPYVVLDGTLIAIDRVKADRPYYSGLVRLLCRAQVHRWLSSERRNRVCIADCLITDSIQTEWSSEATYDYARDRPYELTGQAVSRWPPNSRSNGCPWLRRVPLI